MEGSQYVPEWTIRASVRRHPRAWLIGLLAVLVAVATIVISIVFGNYTGALTDATTCTDWSVATAQQRSGYAQLYLSEYGAATTAGATPAAVIATVTNECNQSALLAESDDVSLIAAVHRRF
jgi:hypothetical protein